MSKHPHREKAKGRPAPRRAPDGAIYVGLVMVGAFAISLWYLFAQGTWALGLIAYVTVVVVLVNLFTFQAVRGHHLAGWQQSLARLPLRAVGYGTRGGKPLEAARGSSSARAMLAVSLAAGVVIVAALTFWLIPR